MLVEKCPGCLSRSWVPLSVEGRSRKAPRFRCRTCGWTKRDLKRAPAFGRVGVPTLG